MAMICYSRIQSKISKGKGGHGVKSGGTQEKASRGSLLGVGVGVTQDVLSSPSNGL